MRRNPFNVVERHGIKEVGVLPFYYIMDEVFQRQMLWFTPRLTSDTWDHYYYTVASST